MNRKYWTKVTLNWTELNWHWTLNGVPVQFSSYYSEWNSNSVQFNSVQSWKIRCIVDTGPIPTSSTLKKWGIKARMRNEELSHLMSFYFYFKFSNLFQRTIIAFESGCDWWTSNWLWWPSYARFIWFIIVELNINILNIIWNFCITSNSILLFFS